MRHIVIAGLALFCGSLNAASIPLGLPPLPVAKASHLEEREALGRQLFLDKRLSADGTISCASCHPPDRYFMDGRKAGKGIGGHQSFRNTPSLFNAAYSLTLFWDGRANSLESQLVGPLTNPEEHGLKDTDEVVAKVRADASYRSRFSAAYAIPEATLGMSQIADAISVYERTLLSGNSAFDRYYYGNEQGALNEAARRGLALFKGRARCSDCHTVGEHSATFSDEGFHRAPFALPQSLTRRLSELSQEVVAAKTAGGNALDDLVAKDSDAAELGRFLVTLEPADIGLFRTPSLRNVAKTAPYLHDGSVDTLPEVIDAELYVRGNAGNYPIVLTADEKGDLLAFLESLTGT